MAKTNLKGSPINTCGDLPKTGTKAPKFTLVNDKLEEVSLADYKGKNIILNIFPSLDTSVCATSVRKFNQDAAKLENTIILAVSADLPFAAGRFCSTEGIKNVIPASVFRNKEFGEDYGVLLVDGPLKGLMARSVVVINPEGNISYTELVPEIGQEPNYQSAIDSIV